MSAFQKEFGSYQTYGGIEKNFHRVKLLPTEKTRKESYENGPAFSWPHCFYPESAILNSILETSVGGTFQAVSRG